MKYVTHISTYTYFHRCLKLAQVDSACQSGRAVHPSPFGNSSVSEANQWLISNIQYVFFHWHFFTGVLMCTPVCIMTRAHDSCRFLFCLSFIALHHLQRQWRWLTLTYATAYFNQLIGGGHQAGLYVGTAMDASWKQHAWAVTWESQPNHQSLHMTHFNFSVPPSISLLQLKLETSNFVHWFAICEVLAFGLTNSPSIRCGHDHVSSHKFWEIIDNISEMVQDKDRVTTED